MTHYVYGNSEKLIPLPIFIVIYSSDIPINTIYTGDN